MSLRRSLVQLALVLGIAFFLLRQDLPPAYQYDPFGSISFWFLGVGFGLSLTFK